MIQRKPFYAITIQFTLVFLLIISCSLPGKLIEIIRTPTSLPTHTLTQSPTETLTPTQEFTSTTTQTPSPTPTHSPTVRTPSPTPSQTPIQPTITPGSNQIVSGQDIWTLTSVDFPKYISTVAQVFYPTTGKKPLISYVYMRAIFDCTTNKSLLEQYTGYDMGLTFVHRFNGYSDVYFQDYRGSKILVTLMGSCWLAAPIPITEIRNTSYILYFQHLNPIVLYPSIHQLLPNEKFVYVSDIYGSPEIFTINEDGTSREQLTNQSGLDVEPDWSPDREYIAFTSERDGNKEVFRMDSSGGSLVNLTNNPSEEGGASWSPVGGLIAFHSRRDANWEIYSMTVDGKNPRNLTNHPGDDMFPSWSPDGSRLVFQSNREGNWEIFETDTIGLDFRRLTNSTSQNLRPVWSPDGYSIAFWSLQDGVWRLNIMDTCGNNLKTIIQFVNPGENPSRASWSIDSKKLLISLFRDNNREIFIINLDGTDSQRLTINSFDDFDPNW